MEINDIYIDKIYDYSGLWDVPSKCGLKIIKKENKSIVIATELYDINPGTSVTEWTAPLATKISKDNSIPFNELVFIEHTRDIGSKLSFNSETFFHVSFEIDEDKLIKPKWNQLSKEDVDSMTA